MKPITLCAVLVAASSCTAHRNDARVDGGVSSDAPLVCGASICDQGPPTTCADAMTLRTSSASCDNDACNYLETDVTCGAGCCTDHCCAVTPSNANAFGTLHDTGLTVQPPNGQFDTDKDCATPSALGNCTVVTTVNGQAPDACVCRADTLTIGNLRVTGSRAIVLLVADLVLVTGTLDVSGGAGQPGPGSYASSAAADTSVYAGGVGGSFGSVGGDASEPVYGTADLVPLLGGTDGQDASEPGGFGGGALQITAGSRLIVQGTINAGGGGGSSGLSDLGAPSGAGGGAGGGVLLEAPVVSLTGFVVANGGGGGGGGGNTGTGGDGGDAGATALPSDTALGGVGESGYGCVIEGYVAGGDGGDGATGSASALTGVGGEQITGCLGAVAFVGGGGAGGGVGRIRINTASGCTCGGTVSPAPSFGALVVN